MYCNFRFNKTVTLLSSLRNYLMYHIKASKTYLHMRMRRKVAGWLQVLNRAVHEQGKKEVKTKSVRTHPQRPFPSIGLLVSICFEIELQASDRFVSMCLELSCSHLVGLFPVV